MIILNVLLIHRAIDESFESKLDLLNFFEIVIPSDILIGIGCLDDILNPRITGGPKLTTVLF